MWTSFAEAHSIAVMNLVIGRQCLCHCACSYFCFSKTLQEAAAAGSCTGQILYA